MVSYGYARVSSTEQNLERQLKAIKQYKPSISDNNIFCDKMTGKTFERPSYEAMKIILEHICKANEELNQQGELVEVIFEELDRLGRDAEGIKKELEWYKKHNICVRILEIPTTLIEINEQNKWVMDLINQILIEVYAAMAQAELEKRAKRQREGIDIALEKGVQFGRKPIPINEGLFVAVYKRWRAGEITARRAMSELGVKSNTFYRRVREYEAMNNSQSGKE